MRHQVLKKLKDGSYLVLLVNSQEMNETYFQEVSWILAQQLLENKKVSLRQIYEYFLYQLRQEEDYSQDLLVNFPLHQANLQGNVKYLKYRGHLPFLKLYMMENSLFLYRCLHDTVNSHEMKLHSDYNLDCDQFNGHLLYLLQGSFFQEK